MKDYVGRHILKKITTILEFLTFLINTLYSFGILKWSSTWNNPESSCPEYKIHTVFFDITYGIEYKDEKTRIFTHVKNVSPDIWLLKKIASYILVNLKQKCISGDWLSDKLVVEDTFNNSKYYALELYSLI